MVEERENNGAEALAALCSWLRMHFDPGLQPPAALTSTLIDCILELRADTDPFRPEETNTAKPWPVTLSDLWFPSDFGWFE